MELVGLIGHWDWVHKTCAPVDNAVLLHRAFWFLRMELEVPAQRALDRVSTVRTLVRRFHSVPAVMVPKLRHIDGLIRTRVAFELAEAMQLAKVVLEYHPRRRVFVAEWALVDFFLSGREHTEMSKLPGLAVNSFFFGSGAIRIPWRFCTYSNDYWLLFHTTYQGDFPE